MTVQRTRKRILENAVKSGASEEPKVEASGDGETPIVEASGDGPARPTNAPKKEAHEAENLQIPMAWGNVVHDTLTIEDPAKLTQRLREELMLGDGRTDYGRILNALDRCAKNLDSAGRLARAAKLAEDRLKIEIDERLEILRSQAKSELMNEYKNKMRPSPTIKDVDDRMLSSWPDEYKALTERLVSMHGTVRSLEVLQSAWASRSADLRIIASQSRSV
jgi:hypothetical protein